MENAEIRCLYCDKKLKRTKKFCNRSCYMKYRRENPGEETLCWSCKNTNGIVCSWFSAEMKPVKGWTAALRPTADGTSYFVKKCPLYEREERR